MKEFLQAIIFVTLAFGIAKVASEPIAAASNDLVTQVSAGLQTR